MKGKKRTRSSSSVALNIKDEETDRLARELAELTGEPITTAVREALVAQLEVVRRRRRVASRHELADIISRGRARRILDDRPDDDLLGYDERGLPS